MNKIGRILRQVLKENGITEYHGSIGAEYDEFAKGLVNIAKEIFDKKGQNSLNNYYPISLLFKNYNVSVPDNSEEFFLRIGYDKDSTTYGSYCKGLIYLNLAKETNKLIGTVIHELTHAKNSLDKNHVDKTIKSNVAQKSLENNTSNVAQMLSSILYLYNYSELNARISGLYQDLRNPQNIINQEIGKYSSFLVGKNQNRLVNYIIQIEESLQYSLMNGLYEYFYNNANNFNYNTFIQSCQSEQGFEPISLLIRMQDKTFNFGNAPYQNIYNGGEKMYRKYYNLFLQRLYQLKNSFYKRASKIVYDYINTIDATATYNQQKLIFKKSNNNSSLSRQTELYKLAKPIFHNSKQNAYQTAKNYF